MPPEANPSPDQKYLSQAISRRRAFNAANQRTGGYSAAASEHGRQPHGAYAVEAEVVTLVQAEKCHAQQIQDFQHIKMEQVEEHRCRAKHRQGADPLVLSGRARSQTAGSSPTPSVKHRNSREGGYLVMLKKLMRVCVVLSWTTHCTSP